MARKKKNLILLLVLCVVLVGFVILYFLMPQKKEEGETDAEATESITVDKIDSTSVSALVIEKEGNEIYSIQKKDDIWQFPDQTAVPLDSDTISGLLDCLNPVNASREIRLEDGQNLSQYGLDNPVMTIKVETDDGKSYQYDLGDVVPITGGYYGITASGDMVYCMEEEIYSTFDIEKNSLIQMEELPEINSSCMTYLEVENKKGSDFEAAVGEDGETWEITKPDKKTLTEGDSDWDTVKGYFTLLAYDSIVEYQADQMSKYGLKEPSSIITIKYYEENDESEDSSATASGDAVDRNSEENREYKTLQLCIGDSCDEGYYVCEKGSSNVYIMAEDVVEDMTKVDEYGLK